MCTRILCYMKKTNNNKTEEWDNVQGIGKLWMEIVLVFGNEPVLFVCKDNHNRRFLVMTYSESEGIYVISPSSSETIFKMLKNLITLREAFTAGKDIYLTSLCEDELVGKRYDSNSFWEELLPKEGATFDLRGGLIDDYSRLLFEEYNTERDNRIVKYYVKRISFVAAAITAIAVSGTVLVMQKLMSYDAGNIENFGIIVEDPGQGENTDEYSNNEESIESNDLDLYAKGAISIKTTDIFKKLVVYAASLDYPVQGEQILEAAGISESDTIAVSIDGREEYTAIELVDQKVVLAYEENGYQVFFQGQYNEKYHWNGECLINSYKNDNLYAATIAVYDDGKRIQYEQLIADSNEWNYTIRECGEDTNIGDTLIYSKTDDLKQKADFNDPKSEDFYDPTYYFEYISEGMLRIRYHGYTSNGKFNDDTGNAYIISYDQDGYVKTLYCGGVKNGKYNDITGTAWYITRNPEKGTKYEYFKGAFENGKANKNYDMPDYIELNRIEELTKNEPYEQYLNWNYDYVIE